MVQLLEVAFPWEGDVMGGHRQDSHTSLVGGDGPKILEEELEERLADEVASTVLGESGLIGWHVQSHLAKVWSWGG